MRTQLLLSAALASPRAPASPRGRPLASPRPLAKAAWSSTAARAVQAPAPLSQLQRVPSRSETQAQDGSEALVTELRSQLEDIWHEYAAARKRSMALLEQSEALQSRVRRLEASLQQEEYHRRAAEAKVAALQAQLQQCEPRQ